MINYNELVQKAYDAMSYSYSPYSKFRVGAALLTTEGKVYTGCNIENASFGATNCAERTAFFKAVSEGEKSFKAIAIVGGTREMTYPCGICRQVIMEFARDIDVILAQGDDYKVFKMEALLPYAFVPEDLDKQK